VSGAGNGIGTLRESSLHAQLKEWYQQPGDGIEVEVGGYLVDLVRGELLIEIQTGNFTAIRAKLRRLLQDHPVRLVYPIAQEKWICRISDEQRPLTRRKSPRRGRLEDLFTELVRLPDVAARPGFSLEVLLTREEEVWRDDGRGSWRRKGWSIADRRLVEVVERRLLTGSGDYLALLPDGLPAPFTNRDLARALGARRPVAERMTYCLRKMGLLEVSGWQERFRLMVRAEGG
jgi:hypothetical protein